MVFLQGLVRARWAPCAAAAAGCGTICECFTCAASRLRLAGEFIVVGGVLVQTNIAVAAAPFLESGTQEPGTRLADWLHGAVDVAVALGNLILSIWALLALPFCGKVLDGYELPLTAGGLGQAGVKRVLIRVLVHIWPAPSTDTWIEPVCANKGLAF